MIGRRGERGSGISVLAARHDNDNGISTIVGYLMTKLVFFISVSIVLYLYLNIYDL